METFLYYPILEEREKQYPYYITTLGMDWEESLVERAQGYPDYQFIFSVEGSGILEIHNKTYLIPPKSVLCLKAKEPHKYYPKDSQWITHWISFNGTGVPELFPYSEPVFPCEFHGEISEIFNLLKESKENNTISEKSTFFLYALLIICKRLLLSDIPKTALEQKLEPVFAFLKENSNRPIGLQELAKIIDVTPAHFCRLFKAATNMRPFEYLTRLKLQNAKELLILHNELSVKQIATLAGFESESYFGAQFKKYEKSSPKKFRELYRNEK